MKFKVKVITICLVSDDAIAITFRQVKYGSVFTLYFPAVQGGRFMVGTVMDIDLQ